jgi:hypothetical protein
MILPDGLNSALNDRRNPFGEAAAALSESARNVARLEKIAKAAELDPRAKAAAVGNMLMGGTLRVGSGPNGNAELVKRAQAPGHFPITSDSPHRRFFQSRVNSALAKMRGNPGHPKMPDFFTKAAPYTFGVGRNVRAVKAASDRNLPMLPGSSGVGLDEDALEILNALPDGRVRQDVIGTIFSRPPQNPNDAYRWIQSIVSLRQQISEMCAGMGLDPKALTNLLDRKVDFYDPMTQSGPATPPPRGYNVSPYPDSPQKWPGEVKPPVDPIDPGDFAGADTTDLNPDFGSEEKLAKFWDSAKRGVDIRKGPMQRQEYEQYGLAVVKSELEGALQKQILLMHATKKRVGATAWARNMKGDPGYDRILRSVAHNRSLTRAMKGACIALIA